MKGLFAFKSRVKILIIDNNAENILLIKSFLNPANYIIETASHIDEITAKVVEFAPDIILLDLATPNIDVYTLCWRLKHGRKTCDIMIVIITTYDRVHEGFFRVRVSFDDFIIKPFNNIIINARIKLLLRSRYYHTQFEQSERVILGLALSVEARDPYTGGHCERLMQYSSALGKRLKIGERNFIVLRRGSILHDVGKVGISDAILLKKGRLTKEEMDIMKSHTIIGERICKPLESLKMVLPIVRHHHEKMDGSGYPDGIGRADLPITVKILQIVDIYDALSTKRPYKIPLSSTEIFNVIEDEVKKGWWDKEIFYEFKDLMMTKQEELLMDEFSLQQAASTR